MNKKKNKTTNEGEKNILTKLSIDFCTFCVCQNDNNNKKITCSIRREGDKEREIGKKQITSNV